MQTLQQLARKIIEKRTERGFVTDPLKIHILLTEEIGEIAAELKRTWSSNYDSFSKERIAEEIADSFCLLVALADRFDIDIEQAVQKKFFGKDGTREWKTASRQWQIFVAPGEESDPLPIQESPWHDERLVRIPKEHWELILGFSESFSKENVELLRRYSWAEDNNEYDYTYAPPEDLRKLDAFMEMVAQKVQNAPPLVPEATEDLPDTYENCEHVRMLEAVRAVFRESVRLRKPFRAWVE